jgi:alkaline phosphatase D
MELLALVALAVRADDVISGGPMPAYAEMTETAIWVQTRRPARIAIEYRPLERLQYQQGQPARWVAATGERKRSAEVFANAANDHIANVRIAGLTPGTRYAYTVLTNGRAARLPSNLKFQTQPHWRWATRPPQPPAFRFLIGSCSYLNQADTDRPGTPYGGDYEIYGAMARQNADFMIWLGDNVYYREMDWLAESEMRQRWRYDRSHPVMQPVLQSMHHYATWDDHDFGPNNSDRSYRLKPEALRVFSDYFPSPVRGLAEAPGVFHRFEWADVEFFLLDDRYHRSPNDAPNTPDKTMLGPHQLQWLKDSLLNSEATFKVVANGGQMVNPMVFFEAFGLFPAEQKNLFDFIAEQRIRGVVFLSGDRHATELLKVQWPGAPYPWFEFTSSPLSSGAGHNDREAENLARVPGTWVTRTRNFGVIDVEGEWRDRRLVFQTLDKDGKTLWRHVISQRELGWN